MIIDDQLGPAADRLHNGLESSPSPRSRRTETVVVALAAITVSVVAVTVLALTGGNRTQSETPFGIWELVELNGHPVVGNASIAFALEPDRAHVANARDGSGFNLHHFHGVGGCNRISGAYGFRGDRLSVVSMFKTAASCGDEVDEEEDDFVSVLRSPKWEVMGDQLSLTGDDGAVALLQELATNPAMGVWALSNIDGATLETTVALTLGRDNLLSGYASCWVSGKFQVEGTVASATAFPRTSPENGPPDRPPELSCNDLNDLEEMFLRLIADAEGRVAGDLMTLVGADGLVATFNRA